MKIITYEPKFRDPIIKLWSAVFPNNSPWNEPNIALDEKLRHQPELLFLAVEEGKLIGTILAGYDGHRGWIYAMAVDNLYRGQGTASALMQKAEQILAELGCRFSVSTASEPLFLSEINSSRGGTARAKCVGGLSDAALSDHYPSVTRTPSPRL